MKTYKELKEETRENAINWQINIVEEIETPTLDEFADKQCYFEKLAKRYGLLREFRENGIC